MSVKSSRAVLVSVYLIGMVTTSGHSVAFAAEAEALKKALAVVVAIEYDSTIHGAGILRTSHGHILTANHVVPESDGIMVRFEGEEPRPATLLARHHRLDFALLDILSDELPEPIPLHFQGLDFGEDLVVIGHPSVTKRSFVPSFHKYRLEDQKEFLIDGDIYSGHSGGPVLKLVDGRYEVIAMIRTRMRIQGGMAIPLKRAQGFIERQGLIIAKTGLVEKHEFKREVFVQFLRDVIWSADVRRLPRLNQDSRPSSAAVDRSFLPTREGQQPAFQSQRALRIAFRKKFSEQRAPDLVEISVFPVIDSETFERERARELGMFLYERIRFSNGQAAAFVNRLDEELEKLFHKYRQPDEWSKVTGLEVEIAPWNEESEIEFPEARLNLSFTPNALLASSSGGR